MTTSGVTTYNETTSTIISQALSLIGAVGAGESVNTNDYNLCLNALNAMLKSWMAQGIHLWTLEEGILYLVQGQAQYTLPGANCSDGTGTPVTTSLAATVSSGTSITVVSTVGMTNGDNIGIQLDNGQLQWTTINGTPGATTITLNAAISSSATSGNAVFTYTTSLGRVVNIHDARYRNSTGYDRRIKIVPRQEYMNISLKNNKGYPIILFYDPQLTVGNIYIWNTPVTVNGQVRFTYSRTLQDLVNSTDTPDFPQEWLEPIYYNLAVRVAPAFGVNLSSGGIQGNPDLLRQAATYLDDLKAWDSEEPYIQVIPANRYNRY